jgi:hypothetical protein
VQQNNSMHGDLFKPQPAAPPVTKAAPDLFGDLVFK